MSAVFKVNGIVLPEPTEYDIEFQPITDGGERNLAGKMVGLVGIAPKYKIPLSWDYLTDSELNTIMGCTWDEFESNLRIEVTFTFPSYAGRVKTIQAYFSPMQVKRTSGAYLNNGWENFSITFIEM